VVERRPWRGMTRYEQTIMEERTKMNEQYKQDEKDESNMENRRVFERSCRNVRETKARYITITTKPSLESTIWCNDGIWKSDSQSRKQLFQG
jgi:hypothetical protein